MDLRQLKAYLIAHKQATLTDLTHHFRAEPQLIQDMLAHWVRKGKVEHTHIDASCSKGCCQAENDLDIYRWTEGKPLDAIQVVQQCTSQV